jgi:hypothetical protein
MLVPRSTTQIYDRLKGPVTYIFRKGEHVYPTDESNRFLRNVGRFISHFIPEDRKDTIQPHK